MVAIKQDTVRMWLKDVPVDKVFWCSDGKVLGNLKELASALGGMGEEIYQHHVSGDKNDFSKWVRDVIGDVTLVNELKKAKTLTTAARCVKGRLERLQARA